MHRRAFVVSIYTKKALLIFIGTALQYFKEKKIKLF